MIRDAPYCAHHYHYLNNSLCLSCNTGIEGRYYEIQHLRKFHLDCFQCHDCHRPLSRDYFEVNNMFFCEVDARRAYQRGQIMGPGRRFPERRMTRLMNMQIS